VGGLTLLAYEPYQQYRAAALLGTLAPGAAARRPRSLSPSSYAPVTHGRRITKEKVILIIILII